jgi:hypothetical protein
VQLQPLPEEFIAGYLQRKKGMPQPEARKRAARSQGSLSRAVRDLPAVDGLIQEVEGALAAKDEIAALDLADVHGERDDALEMALSLQAWTRDLLVAQTGAPERVLELRDLAELALQVSSRLSPQALLSQAELCGEVIEALEQNGNGRLQLERLLLGTRELRHG